MIEFPKFLTQCPICNNDLVEASASGTNFIALGCVKTHFNIYYGFKYIDEFYIVDDIVFTTGTRYDINSKLTHQSCCVESISSGKILLKIEEFVPYGNHQKVLNLITFL